VPIELSFTVGRRGMLRWRSAEYVAPAAARDSAHGQAFATLRSSSTYATAPLIGTIPFP
jgi:hypothetical protein